jgi:hypothetical protein
VSTQTPAAEAPASSAPVVRGYAPAPVEVLVFEREYVASGGRNPIIWVRPDWRGLEDAPISVHAVAL